jgi:polyferredoxin
MDLLRQPFVGPVLRWRHLRATMQLVLLAVAAVVVLHGLFGPQIAPRNLATVLTSIHWRGLLVVALLAAGNLFCTACPMMLARNAGRRVVHPVFRWPRRLRGKWLGLGLLIVVLFSYELFDLWELPRATAWIVLGYFGLALAVDLTFKGAVFCRHICPIGQFNFTASTMSPTELQVRDVSTCHACRTSDCIKGRYTAVEPKRLERRGCELGLFLPAKVGNLDCTLCLDCVRACPHENIALVTRVPGVEWLVPGRRSGLGRLTQRTDVAALALVFTFAALLAAFAMTAPARSLGLWFAGLTGVRGEAAALALLFVFALVVLPALLLAGAATVTQRLAGEPGGLRPIAIPYVYALVPLGFSVWLAHYGFHLLTGILTIVPVAQSASIDLWQAAVLGAPKWTWAGMRSGSVWPIQVGFVLLGAAGSISLVWATSLRDYPRRPGHAAVAWVVLVAALAVLALWILAQPMDMRGITAPG